MLWLVLLAPWPVEGQRIRGQVESVEGPVVGAEILLETADLTAGVVPIQRTARSDLQGRFEVEAPMPGFWRLRVTAEGWLPQERVISPSLEPVNVPEVELHRGRTVVLEVSGRDGDPLDGVLLWPVLGAEVDTWHPSRSRWTLDAGQRIELRIDPAWPDLWVATTDGFLDRISLEIEKPAVNLWHEPEHGPLDFRVIDSLGRAQAGLEIWTLDGSYRLAQADDAGRVRWTKPGDTIDEILLRSPQGWQSVRALDGEDAVGEPSGGFRLWTVDPPPVWRGQVVDEISGEPLVSALVWNGNGGPAALAMTDNEGTFFLPGSDERSIHAVAPRYHAKGIRPRQGEPLQLALVPKAWGRGQVEDEHGQPIGSAEVIWRLALAGEAQEFHTEADGRFVVSPLQNGRYDLEVRAEGFQDAWIAGLELEVGSEPLDLGVVRLSAASVADGWVFDADGGPVEGVRIQIGRERASSERAELVMHRVLEDLQSASDGSFRLSSLTETEVYWWIASKFGYQTARGRWSPRDRAALEIEIEESSSISGWVLGDDGRPLVGALITSRTTEKDVSIVEGHGDDPLSRARYAMSDEEGTFVLEGMPGGALQITVEAAGYRELRREMTLRSGESLDGVALRLQQGFALAGSVHDELGPASAMVWLERDSGEVEQLLRVTDGKFAFNTPEPGGYTLVAENPMGRRAQQTLNWTGMEPQTFELVLEPGAELAGQVLDAEGHVLAGVAATLLPTDKNRASIQTVTDTSGRFVFAGVPPGSYRILTQRSGFVVHTTELNLEDYPLTVPDIVLDSAIRLESRTGGTGEDF